MTATRRFAATLITTTCVLALAACTWSDGEAEPSNGATASAPPPATADDGQHPTPLAGTALVNPASAMQLAEGDGVTSELLSRFSATDAYDVFLGFGDSGELLALRVPNGQVDGDQIVKPSECGWFDGDFRSLGSTADLVAGDAARQSSNEWTDGSTVAWVESAGASATGTPWRIFAAEAGGVPALVAASEGLGRPTDMPLTPDPVAFDGRVYWMSETPAGEILGTGTWSAPVGGGDAQLLMAGAESPAATSVGVFALTTLPESQGGPMLAPGVHRVARMDGEVPGQTLRIIEIAADGELQDLIGAGDWLAAKYTDGWGTSGGIVVFDASEGKGYTVAPISDSLATRAVICDEALVWLEPGDDWLADVIYRLDLPTGDISAIEAPSAFDVLACDGDRVIWSQAGQNRAVNQFLSTIE